MNYLAHLHLAYVSNTSYCGNLLGDFSKEVDIAKMPEELITGIKMHQYIDKTVDNYPASIEFRMTQKIGRRRFAGIIQDILMDYWLVNKWGEFNEVSLDGFYHYFLPNLLEYHAVCPPRLQSLINSLNQNRWLANLGELEGVEKAIRSIMNRWKHGHHLQPFYDELPLLFVQSESVFDQIYPALVREVVAVS